MRHDITFPRKFCVTTCGICDFCQYPFLSGSRLDASVCFTAIICHRRDKIPAVINIIVISPKIL